MPPRLKVPTHSDPVKRWNFRKADWNRFCLLLTGESVQRLPPPDATNVEKAYQELCESLLSATKQCTPRGRLKKYMQCWTKSARSFIAPSSEPQFVLTLTEPLPIYFLGSNRRGRSDGNKLSIPSNSRTPAARRGAPRMNLLACLDAPPLCTPSQQTPSSHNSWRTGHTRPGVASPGSPTRSFPTYGRSRHPRETASLAPSRHGGPSCCPQVPEASKVPGSGSYLPGVFTPRRVGFQSLVLWFPHVLLKIPTIWRRALIVAMPKPEKPLKDPKSYRPMSLLCPLQDPQETHLRFYRSNHQPIAPAVACRLLTREVERRPGHPADTGHRG